MLFVIKYMIVYTTNIYSQRDIVMKTTEEYARTVVKEEHLNVDGISYEYKLTVRISEVTSSFKLPLYSVEAAMTKPDGKTTSAVCADAFADVGKAMIFFDKVVRFNATPIDLAYVYEDDLH